MQLSRFANMADLESVYLTMDDLREIADADPDSHWFSSAKYWGVSTRSLNSTSVKRITSDEYRFIVREFDSYEQTTKSYRVFSAKLSVHYRGSSADNLTPYWHVSVEACRKRNDDKTYFTTREAAERKLTELKRSFTD